jgi:hypothetical protein
MRSWRYVESFPAVAHELGFVVSAVNTIVKDAALIKEHVNLFFV